VPYTDAFGFAYRLCPRHYENLVRALVAHEEVCLPASVVLPEAAPKRPTGHQRKAPPGVGPVADVSAEEQRRARAQVGWSLRQLAQAVDRSYSQVQASERGVRPVDPVVAVWVRSVLDVA
jgi:hypothetical protein